MQSETLYNSFFCRCLIAVLVWLTIAYHNKRGEAYVFKEMQAINI